MENIIGTEVVIENNNEMDIINISDYGDALRSSGYKNIESAMAEIIDNAIQADAHDILTIIKDKVPNGGRKSQVYEIAFLDNGNGMNPEWVQKCLRFGSGTRQNVKGMGRFGVGLPQSSMYACPRVEVYSWQNGIENTYMSWLDIDMVNLGQQTKILPAIKTNLPDSYKKYIKNATILGKSLDFSKKGTLVLWLNCDNVEPRTVSPLFARLQFSLGQKYRYLIKEGINNIYLIHDTKEHLNKRIVPNDPLFLIDNNVILGNPSDVQNINNSVENKDGLEPIFEPYPTILHPNGVVPIEVTYYDRHTKQKKNGVVTVKFSIVKEKFYDQEHMTCPNPGNTDLGQYIGKLEGISVVRENREIDFGEFDFYSDKNSPYHRWWGCEINFGRELDEMFKVSNNKQHVELIKLDGGDYADDEYKPIWLILEPIITPTIANMVKRNKALRKDSRLPVGVTSMAESTATKVENNEDGVSTASEEIRKDKPIEEVIATAKDILEERGCEEPTKEDIDKILLQKVLIKEVGLGENKPYLFDFSVETGLCICTINTDHIYYENFVENMDAKSKTAFLLLLASLARTADEAPRDKRSLYSNLINEWNFKMNRYLIEYLGLDK